MPQTTKALDVPVCRRANDSLSRLLKNDFPKVLSLAIKNLRKRLLPKHHFFNSLLVPTLGIRTIGRKPQKGPQKALDFVSLHLRVWTQLEVQRRILKTMNKITPTTIAAVVMLSASQLLAATFGRRL
jgi:hypothetical protein